MHVLQIFGKIIVIKYSIFNFIPISTGENFEQYENSKITDNQSEQEDFRVQQVFRGSL